MSALQKLSVCEHLLTLFESLLPSIEQLFEPEERLSNDLLCETQLLHYSAISIA
jgi:hypothetical protein